MTYKKYVAIIAKFNDLTDNIENINLEKKILANKYGIEENLRDPIDFFLNALHQTSKPFNIENPGSPVSEVSFTDLPSPRISYDHNNRIKNA